MVEASGGEVSGEATEKPEDDAMSVCYVYDAAAVAKALLDNFRQENGS